MAKLNPYLFFSGNCREAMTFYKEVLGGELVMQTVGDSPMAAKMPPEAKNNIMHSMLTTDCVALMASDMTDPDQLQGSTMSLCLVCNSKEEIERLFAKLSVGGTVEHALKEEYFGTF